MISENPSPADEKKRLRRLLLDQRQELPQSQWQRRSQQICDHLRESAIFQRSRYILGFTSFRQEPDLSNLYHASDPAKTWGFPRCVGRELSWHEYRPGLDWVSGAYGIQEPSSQWPRVDRSQVDLILVPAVACDRGGMRLGYGGGFYDRCLSAWNARTVTTIGITFEFAYYPQLPAQSWDQPLDFVCTESGLMASSAHHPKGSTFNAATDIDETE